MEENTKQFILNNTNETKPGPYYQQPKTHKFNEETHEMSNGFPARGIISCNKSPTESLQDFMDFKLNPSMKELKSYIKDTKHVLQI